MKKNFFLTFEGTDGVGKTTHIKLLSEWLTQKGFRILQTREPGGGPFSERIRAILLDPTVTIDPLTELFLYETARIEHFKNTIVPALHKGQVVLCDRFIDATVAYQGFGRGISTTVINRLNSICSSGVKPDLTLWLDLPIRIGLHRIKERRQKMDRIEQEGAKFQKRVRHGYSWISKREPNRVKRILVQESMEATQRKIRDTVAKKFHL